MLPLPKPPPDPHDLSRGLTWLLCGMTGAFLLQFGMELAPFNSGRDLAVTFAVTSDALAAGRMWTLLTHWLLHSTTNIFHVVFSIAGIFLLGRELEQTRGPRAPVVILGFSTLIGALTWLAVNHGANRSLIGSTAGVYGLLMFFTLSEPRRELQVLLFFAFPVSIRPRQLVAGLAVFDVIGLVLVDILDRPMPFEYAPSAHLGGLLAGWGCFRFLPHLLESGLRMPTKVEIAGSGDQVSDKSVPPAPNHVESVRSDREGLRQQVDRILDKINREGLASLTDDERRTLDNARDLLNRR